VKKGLFKYLLSIFVLLSSNFGWANIGIDYLEEASESTTPRVVCLTDNELFDTIFSTNRESNSEDPLLVIIEKEVDEDETETDNDESVKKFSPLPSFILESSIADIQPIHQKLIFQSHFEDLSQCRYILYQVFRI
jgi:hypothetical protein